MNTRLISLTSDAENLIAYCARVSNPNNQDSNNIEKLLKYCADHGHWSIFEMANMVIEINTTRGLAAQILRHRSFSFQEFSQRYADASLLSDKIDLPELRRQDTKNRQNSIDDISDEIKSKWKTKLREHFAIAKNIYDEMLKDGIAKESARFVLPLSTPTRLYMNGTIRSWIHYIKLRTGHGTQKEHIDIANDCKNIFTKHLPTISGALGWKA
jgi:thymidylate synthase (FAD)